MNLKKQLDEDDVSFIPRKLVRREKLYREKEQPPHGRKKGKLKKTDISIRETYIRGS